jgi:hypothetical protein
MKVLIKSLHFFITFGLYRLLKIFSTLSSLHTSLNKPEVEFLSRFYTLYAVRVSAPVAALLLPTLSSDSHSRAGSCCSYMILRMVP